MIKLLSFLKKKKEIFNKNNPFVIFAIYSDKIEAFLVKKNSQEIEINFLDSEYQEDIFLDGDIDINNLKLNCSKLKVKISEKNIKVKNIIFGVSSEIVKAIFISKSKKRNIEDKKIKKNEIDEMILNLKKEYKKNNKTLFLNEIQNYFVDGYKIKNPIGFLGQEIKIDTVAYELKKNINLRTIFKSLAIFLNLKFRGIFALDTVLFLAEKEFKQYKDIIFINILNKNISIFLIKNTSVKAIDNLNLGYGIFDQKISEDFKVGIEEAKDLRDKFLEGNLDIEIMERLRKIAISESENILNKVKVSLVNLDRSDLLPKNIFISFSAKPLFQIEQVFKKANNWFSDLPFPQDVDIIFLNTIDMSAIISKSLTLSNKNKNLYTNFLVNGILKNINNFK